MPSGKGNGAHVRELSSDFNLNVLANHYGSDKGTVCTRPDHYPHHYTRLYEMLLGPRRASLARMLEIGLLVGGPEVGNDADRATGELPSVRMWLDYFPEAIVHGFDISDFSFFSDPRFRFTRGDAGVAADLLKLVAQGERYGFIIDDGSHASFHQQLAFQHLFPHVEPGGIYIIEDLHWQSPFYEKRLPPTHRTVDMFDCWFQTGRFPKPAAAELADLPALGKDIAFAFIVNQPFTGNRRRPKVVVIQKNF